MSNSKVRNDLKDHDHLLAAGAGTGDGALAGAHSGAQVSIAVTDVAGPGGGRADKPVGTVWFGWNVCGELSSELMHFEGSRAIVRAATVRHALYRLVSMLAVGAK